MSDVVCGFHFARGSIAIHRRRFPREEAKLEAAVWDPLPTRAHEVQKRYLDHRRANLPIDTVALSSLGRELYAALNGPGSWLDKLLDEARKSGARLLVLQFSGDPKFREIPWELLAAEGIGFLTFLSSPLISPVRLPWAGNEPAILHPDPPAERDPSILYMASAPRGVEPELRYEEEETRIEHAVPSKRVELVTEETGSLVGLRERLLSRPDGGWHAIHLSCHGNLHPQPCLVLEDIYGERDVVSAGRLLSEGFADRVPRLCFISACHSAEGSVDGAKSLAEAVSAVGVPNVLGWAASVLDAQATDFAKHFYLDLCAGLPVESAAAHARHELGVKGEGRATDWFLARLYLGANGGGPLCKAETERAQAVVYEAVQSYLDQRTGKVPVARPDQFVGRRQQMRTALTALRPQSDKLGVALFGLGGVGKSSLAGRLLQRLDPGLKLEADQTASMTPIFLIQKFDAHALIGAIADAFLGNSAVLNATIDCRRALEAAGADAETTLLHFLGRVLKMAHVKKAHPLFVLDDFENALQPLPGQDFRLTPEALPAVRALFKAAIASRAAKLLITCRYKFVLPDDQGANLLDRLEAIMLPQFSDSEQWRAIRRVDGAIRERLDAGNEAASELLALLNRCRLASRGNPRLLALLVRLANENAEKVKNVLAEMEKDPRLVARVDESVPATASAEVNQVLDFYRSLALTNLLELAGSDARQALRVGMMFELPIPRSILEKSIVGVSDGAKAVERGLSLGLWDVHLAPRAAEPDLRVPNVVRDLLKDSPLPEEEQKEVARRCCKPLFDHWGGEKAIDANEAGQLWPLAWLAESVEVIVPAGATLGHALVGANRYKEAAAVTSAALQAGQSSDLHHAAARAGTILGDASALLYYEQAKALAESKPEKARSKPEARAIAAIYSNMAGLLARQGDVNRAMDLWRESRVRLEQLGDVQGEAATLSMMAAVVAQQGDVNRAMELWRESLALKEQIGDVQGKAATLNNMAGVVAQQGDVNRAMELWHESLALKEELGDVRGKAATLHNIASVAAQRGDVEEATRLWEESLALKDQIGDVRGRAATLNNMAGAVAQLGQLDRALDWWRESLAIKTQIGDAQGRAVTLVNMAQGLVKQGHPDAAAEALGRLRDAEEELFRIEAFPDLLSASEIGTQVALQVRNNTEARRSAAYRVRAALRLNAPARAAEGLWVLVATVLKGEAPWPTALPELALLGYRLCEKERDEHFVELVNAAASSLKLTQKEFSERAKAVSVRIESGILSEWLEPILHEYCAAPLSTVVDREGLTQVAETKGIGRQFYAVSSGDSSNLIWLGMRRPAVGEN